MWPLIGGLISGASNFLSGLFGNSARKEQQYWNNIAAVNAANQAATNQERAIAAQRAMMQEQQSIAAQVRREDISLQREFASTGIQMRAADAVAAGIHPVFALGGGGAAFSPQGISLPGIPNVPVAPVPNVGAPLDNPMAGLGAMGQDLSRALVATMTQQQRDLAFDQTARDLSLQNLTLRNDLLASQIAKLRSQTGPARPDTGSSFVTGMGEVKLADEKLEGTTPLIFGGKKIISDQTYSDAQKFEDRYGEGADFIFGPYIMYKDYLANSGATGLGELFMQSFRNSEQFGPWKGLRGSSQWTVGR